MVGDSAETKFSGRCWNSALVQDLSSHHHSSSVAKFNRNSFNRITFALLLFVLATLKGPLSIIAAVDAVVVGIDFGDQNIKAVFVSPGRQFETLLSPHSQRKIPNGVTFETVEQLISLGPTAPSRVFGEDVESYSTKRFQTSFLSPTMYLGRSFDDALNGENNSKKILGINSFQHFYPFEYIEDDQRGTWKFRVSPDVDMFAEEITSHILWYIKSRVLSTLELKDSRIGCVLTIPCSFTQRQRQSLSDAAQIAGWDVLGLVHTSLSAAIQMSLDEKVNESKNILFYSVGSQRIDAGIVHFEINSGKNSTKSQYLQLLSCVSMEGYGGQYIDLAISELVAAEFESQHGISLKENPKALKMILRQANRVKHLLSANKETTFVVESLSSGLDLKVRFSRTQLEHALLEMGLLERLKKSVDEALHNANLTMNNIDAIELLGGGWRIPWIRGELQHLFAPVELGQHLNSDEAPARGAAFMAANRSVSYRVRPIHSVDIATFAYPISIENFEKNISTQFNHTTNSSKLLLQPTSRLNGLKKIVLQAAGDLEITISENDSDHPLDLYIISGITEAKTGKYKELGLPKVTIIFKIDPAGIIQMHEASAVFEETVLVPVVPRVQNSTIATNKSNDTTAAKNETTTQEQPSTSEIQNQLDGSAVNDTSNSTANTTIPTVEEKKVLHKVKLAVERKSYFPVPMSKTQKEAAKMVLEEYNAKDHAAEQLTTERNAFESYIYRAKSLLKTEVYILCSLETARTALFLQLETDEEWLYDNMYANYSVVHERLSALTNLFEPIALVAVEYENRPSVIETMNSYLVKEEKAMNALISSKPWLSSNLTDYALTSLKDLNAWWETVQKQQLALPPSSHPSFTKAEVDTKIREQDITRAVLQMVPPPKKADTLETNTTKSMNETRNETANNSSTRPDPSPANENSEKLDAEPTNITINSEDHNNNTSQRPDTSTDTYLHGEL